MKDVTFGQFYPVNSFVHKMDPRTKILLVIAYIVAIFLVKNFVGFVVMGAFLVIAILASRVPVRSVIKSVKPVLFLVIFTAILNLLFYSEGEVVFTFWIVKIRDGALRFSGFMALRLIMLVLGTSLLTLTTQPVALTDGIESLLKPLKVVRFPVHELALVMSIALRFIPTLMDETDRIIRAQKARGADFESGNLISRAKALLPILIPLLISAFRRADELADAMDARCYSGSKGRTKMKVLKMGIRDVLGFAAMTSVFFLILACNALFLI